MDNSVTVSTQEKGSNKVTVSSSGINGKVDVTADTAQYWSEKSREWAISDEIVDREDYSSKWWAKKSKEHADIAIEQVDIVKEEANNVKQTVEGFNDTVNEAIQEIDKTKETAISDVSAEGHIQINKIQDEVKGIDETISQGLIDISQNKDNAIGSIQRERDNILDDIEQEGNKQVQRVIDEGDTQEARIRSNGFYMEDDKLYYVDKETGETKEFKSGGGAGLPVGTILPSAFIIHEEDGLQRYLNGSIMSINKNTKEFVNRLKETALLYPSLVCSEEEWQEIATNSVVGQCGKFVLDEENQTIRLPKIIMPVQCLTDITKLGEIVEQGMPPLSTTIASGGSHSHTLSLKANAGSAWASSLKAAWGGDNVISNSNYTGTTNSTGSHTHTATTTILGINETKQVQQEQIQYPYFIQIATGAEYEVNITNKIELNNPYSFGDFKYLPYRLNDIESPNASWLLSLGQENNKDGYENYYNWILKNANKGVESFKFSNADTIKDSDFVVNTENQTFRLPLKPHIENEESKGKLFLYYYIGATVQNSDIINAGRFTEQLAQLAQLASKLDGKWIGKKQQITTTATKINSYPISLEEYLPNDENEYEVLVEGLATRSADINAVSVISLSSSTISEPYLFLRLNSKTTMWINSVSFPIGKDHVLTIVVENEPVNTIDFKLCGYRKLGKSE